MKALIIPGPAIAQQIDDIGARLRAGGVDVTIGQAADIAAPNMPDVAVIAGPGSLPCDAALFARTPGLRGLVAIGSGCEGFDRAAASDHGVTIRSGATRENTAGMASATIMLMLALAHDLPGAQAALRAGRRRDPGRVGSLDGLQLGLIGYGAIGREIARRLRAWDIAVTATSPSRLPGTVEHGVSFVTLDDLIANSDVISLHAALSRSSYHILDRARIARIKHGALIVNTARGGLIDEDALADALTDGRVGGAALDCFEQEPLAVDSPLRAAPDIILTPHQIGHTARGMAIAIDTFVDNILSFRSLA